MTVIGIDPGPEQSAYVRWDGQRVLRHGIEQNACLRGLVRAMVDEVTVIEQVESYGMAVGRDVFETVHEAGRIYEATRGERRRLTRRAVKLHLCGSSRAKDSNIRAALIDRFGGTGGRRAAVGLKASPRPALRHKEPRVGGARRRCDVARPPALRLITTRRTPAPAWTAWVRRRCRGRPCRPWPGHSSSSVVSRCGFRRRAGLRTPRRSRYGQRGA